jgi:hypothetical protein
MVRALFIARYDGPTVRMLKKSAEFLLFIRFWDKSTLKRLN